MENHLNQFNDQMEILLVGWLICVMHALNNGYVGYSAAERNMRKGIEGLSESTARYLLQKNKLAIAQSEKLFRIYLCFLLTKPFSTVVESISKQMKVCVLNTIHTKCESKGESKTCFREGDRGKSVFFRTLSQTADPTLFSVPFP